MKISFKKTSYNMPQHGQFNIYKVYVDDVLQFYWSDNDGLTVMVVGVDYPAEILPCLEHMLETHEAFATNTEYITVPDYARNYRVDGFNQIWDEEP